MTMRARMWMGCVGMAMAGSVFGAPVPIDLGTQLVDLSAGSGGQVLQIELTGDGQNDLGFSYFELAPGAQLATIEVVGRGRGISDVLSNTWPDANLTYPPVPPADIVVELASGGSVMGSVDTYAPSSGFGFAAAALFLDPVLLGDPSVTAFDGTVAVNRDFYIGFKFLDVTNAMHYGWVQCRLDWDNVGPTTEQWTILAGAYESDANTDIAAGDSGSVACVADVDDGSGTGTPDGGVTIDDLLYYLNIFNAGSIAADVDDGSGTGITDGGVTIDDLLYFLTRFNSGC